MPLPLVQPAAEAMDAGDDKGMGNVQLSTPLSQVNTQSPPCNEYKKEQDDATSTTATDVAVEKETGLLPDPWMSRADGDSCRAGYQQLDNTMTVSHQGDTISKRQPKLDESTTTTISTFTSQDPFAHTPRSCLAGLPLTHLGRDGGSFDTEEWFDDSCVMEDNLAMQNPQPQELPLPRHDDTEWQSLFDIVALERHKHLEDRRDDPFADIVPTDTPQLLFSTTACKSTYEDIWFTAKPWAINLPTEALLPGKTCETTLPEASRTLKSKTLKSVRFYDSNNQNVTPSTRGTNHGKRIVSSSNRREELERGSKPPVSGTISNFSNNQRQPVGITNCTNKKKEHHCNQGTVTYKQRHETELAKQARAMTTQFVPTTNVVPAFLFLRETANQVKSTTSKFVGVDQNGWRNMVKFDHIHAYYRPYYIEGSAKVSETKYSHVGVGQVHLQARIDDPETVRLYFFTYTDEDEENGNQSFSCSSIVLAAQPGMSLVLGPDNSWLVFRVQNFNASPCKTVANDQQSACQIKPDSICLQEMEPGVIRNLYACLHRAVAQSNA